MAVEAEVRAKDILAEEAEFPRLLDRLAQTHDSSRILRTYIEISILCADCVTRNHHALDDAERIALENGTIHERTRIAFVTVADNILFITLRAIGKLPFAAGREAAAAASAQTGSKDLIDDLLARHGQCTLQTLERAHADRFVDILGIDDAAAVKRNTALLLIECNLVLLGNLLMRNRILIQKAIYDNAVPDVGLDDLIDIVDRNHTIQGIFREDLDKRTLGTETEASYLIDGSLVVQSLFLQKLYKTLTDLRRIAGKTSGTAAEHDVTLSVFAGELVFEALRT